MANADPPDKVDDRESPTDGNIDSPETDTVEKQVRDRQQQQLKQRERNRKADEPADRRLALQYDRADLVSDRTKGQLGAHDRMRRVNRQLAIVVFVHLFVPSPSGRGLG